VQADEQQLRRISMTGKQTFTDAASVGKMLVIVPGLLVLIAVCWFVVAGTALGMAVNLSVLGGLFLLTALMVLLAYNLSTHRTVACDVR
jgi:CHASE2 domain-containing sensor protein